MTADVAGSWDLTSTTRRYYRSNLAIAGFFLLFGTLLIGYVTFRTVNGIPIPAAPTLTWTVTVSGVAAWVLGVVLALPFPRQMELTADGAVFRAGRRVVRAVRWSDPRLSLTFVDVRGTPTAARYPDTIYGLIFVRMGPWWRPSFPIPVEAFDGLVAAARQNGCHARVIGSSTIESTRKLIRISRQPTSTPESAG